MKKILIFLFITQWMFSYSQCVKREVIILKKVLSAYIGYTESDRKIDKDNEILISYWMKHPDYPIQIIGASFFSPAFLKDVNYSEVFDYKGYKLVLVSDDIKDFEKSFGKYFKKREYENINKSKNIDINWDTRNISVELNERLEIISINPETKDLMKNLIDNKLVIAKDCSCLQYNQK